MWMTMGNRMLPKTDGCCATLDTSDDAPRDESTEKHLKPPTLTPARDSFEIMSHFTWEMVDTTLQTFFSY